MTHISQKAKLLTKEILKKNRKKNMAQNSQKHCYLQHFPIIVPNNQISIHYRKLAQHLANTQSSMCYNVILSMVVFNLQGLIDQLPLRQERCVHSSSYPQVSH